MIAVHIDFKRSPYTTTTLPKTIDFNHPTKTQSLSTPKLNISLSFNHIRYTMPPYVVPILQIPYLKLLLPHLKLLLPRAGVHVILTELAPRTAQPGFDVRWSFIRDLDAFLKDGLGNQLLQGPIERRRGLGSEEDPGERVIDLYGPPEARR
jgi:hypothetical protein